MVRTTQNCGFASWRHILAGLALVLLVAHPANAQRPKSDNPEVKKPGSEKQLKKRPSPTSVKRKPASQPTKKTARTKKKPATLPTSKPVEKVAKKRSLKKHPPLLKGGIFDRPYLFRHRGSSASIAIGGYAEMLGSYIIDEGVNNGFSFEMRRFNIFIFSQISDYIRLTAELEFEHGASEITLETALIDVMFHPMINLRMGIVLVPLGRFNLAHDSPRYDIIDRPLVSTLIIPSTYSDVGGGVFGRFYLPGGHKFTYELYVINGLGPGVVGGSSVGTRIAKGKTEDLFAKNPNGQPAFAGRIGYETPFGLEVGVSMYTGIYSKYQQEGVRVDGKRRLTVFAFDFEYSWRRMLTVRGEMAYAMIKVPDSLKELYGTRQFGAYVDVIWTFWKGKLWFMENTRFNLALRGDWVDLNIGSRSGTRQDIGDENLRVTLAISWRPVRQTSIRVAYQHNWIFDPIKNKKQLAGIQVGFATYF